MMNELKELVKEVLENQKIILENQHFIRKAIIDNDNNSYEDFTELRKMILEEATTIKNDIYFYSQK